MYFESGHASLEQKRHSIRYKKPLPVLSFPSVQLLGITVKDLISDSDTQAAGMKAIADRNNAAASVNLTDLSVGVKCFGSTIHISGDAVPTVIGSFVSSEEEADALDVMRACCNYPNYAISSCCDIPPLSSWDNNNAFFAAAEEFYQNRK